MRTLCLTLAYDGTNYAGWQVQPEAPTLQQAVEQALSEFTGERIHAAASGRTDAKVHALGQLVSFETTTAIPVEGFRWGLVTRLPPDIVVRDVREMPLGFHARFDTVRKHYRYVIHTSRTPSPWLRNYVWWYRGELNDRSMQAAADVLLGTHDFRCFETQWPNRSSSVRTIFEARFTRHATWNVWQDDKLERGLESGASQSIEESSAPFLCFDIAADGFLYNMVRAIVGSLIPVGRGRWNADNIAQILATGQRAEAGDNAPPQGLYLTRAEIDVDPVRIADRRRRYEELVASRAHAPTTVADSEEISSRRDSDIS